MLVHIYNDNAHIGAVAMGDFDAGKQRASASVITRLGHKDTVIAQSAAYSISRATGKLACVVAGVHIDAITAEEIDEVLQKTDMLVVELLAKLGTP